MNDVIRADLPLEWLAFDGTSETAHSKFDNYRSVADPAVQIFVISQSVPPFRFNAGGWDLVQESIELGPAMAKRIAERGFFMCRSNGPSDWVELDHLEAKQYAEKQSPDDPSCAPQLSRQSDITSD